MLLAPVYVKTGRTAEAARRFTAAIDTVERRVGSLALVRVTAPRAVRHQIRAHFASIGHPLVGDSLYGEPGTFTEAKIDRHALHAARVALKGEIAFDVSSDLPQDIAALLAP